MLSRAGTAVGSGEKTDADTDVVPIGLIQENSGIMTDSHNPCFLDLQYALRNGSDVSSVLSPGYFSPLPVLPPAALSALWFSRYKFSRSQIYGF